MGVPAFYRWLSEKYPKIVTDILEQRVALQPGSSSIPLPFDLTQPNPSNLECDNFYIDMNGIIHPCSHPEEGSSHLPQPKNEEEMYDNICKYVDRLMRAVRPRKLLYLAIDGVAPRAKMNQQRSRRFRSAQEARESAELENEIKDSLIQAGHKFDENKKNGAGGSGHWDSNVITPGTKFMLNLSEYIRFYIRKRISTDPAWKQLTVIFSDASIPGEGEHKIMSHIRQQRSQPNYDPNLVHILHGLDADLIMLALATHEAHFYIMREEVLFGRRHAETVEQMREESGFTDAQQQLDAEVGSQAMALPDNKYKILQRISIPILREYLAFEFGPVLQSLHRCGFKEVSFERLIDDIVFMCFFVGNDFLPHLPSLDIRDGALDFLFNVYKRVLPTLGDFITDHGGEVNLSHVDVILAEVGAIEDYVFQMKHENEENEKKRKAEQQERRKKLKNGKFPNVNHVETEPPPKVRGRAARILEQQSISTSNNNFDGAVTALGKKNNPKEAVKKSLDANLRAAEELKATLMKGKSSAVDGKINNDTDNKATSPSKRKADEISPDDNNESNKEETEEDDDVTGESESNGIVEVEDDENDDEDETEVEFDQEAHNESLKVLQKQLKEAGQKKLSEYAENVDDKVRLHEKGWKYRYYTDKCKADDVMENGGKEHLFRSYIVGLCWVMKYYYDGCPSWKWYFPFHYAPFASDLKNIERFKKDCKFELGEPFKPVEQLMAVLPEDSSHAIPKASRWLMSDSESPIIDFYPKDVPCDPNGKAMPWLWVVLLPFIDEDRLLSAFHPTIKGWTESEKLCNARGVDDGYIYCHVNHTLSSSVVPTLDSGDKTQKMPIEEGNIFGLLRCPLSNEMYPLDKVSVIHPPSSSTKITNQSFDDLLTSPIETNAALCAAFTEPEKCLHKSVLLKGATPPSPTLKEGEFHIRRPKLNRGGGTIANMGGGGRHGKSHQNGYGSMNIGSYERELAARSGRGDQMNQAGTRQWGSMEPTAKRQRFPNNHNNSHNTHYQYNHQQQHVQHQYRPSLHQPISHSYNSHHNYNHHHQRSQWQNNNNKNNQYSTSQYSQVNQGRWNPPANHPAAINLPQPPLQRPPQHNSQPPQQRNGYNFQSFNNSNQSSSNGRGGHNHGHAYSRHGYQQNQTQNHSNQHQQHQQRSGVSSSVMSSLKAQLASTLNRNRQNGQGGGGNQRK